MGAGRSADLERRRVARLFARAGFGATLTEIDQAVTKGYGPTVDSLLSFPAAGQGMAQTDLYLEEATASGQTDVTTYGAWWLGKMATTTQPLEEKLTLYWHGHFATTFRKVWDMPMMLRQNGKLRSFAGGNFRQLCKAITVDEAMLAFLDGNTNNVGKPNENYGREFMELFTLGKDLYTQADVRAAARAFTGYYLDGSGTAKFDAHRHDAGRKTLLGQTGHWGAADVTDIVLDRHPKGRIAATHTATRIARFFHHPNPEPAVVQAMTTAFVDSGYEIKPMMKALFLRPEFMDGPTLTIKSPAELVAGTSKALGLDTRDAFGASSSAAMGQELFNPPSVAGWSGGRAWANTATTLARYNFACGAAQRAVDDVSNGLKVGLAGQRRDALAPWMERLGLVGLVASTQSAVAEYLNFSKTAGNDEATTGRGLLTLLLASPDMNLR